MRHTPVRPSSARLLGNALLGASSDPRMLRRAVVTFSTVGYGDASPNSHAGRAIAVFAIAWGLVISAMPLAIVSEAYNQAWQERISDIVVAKVQEHVLAHDGSLQAIQRFFKKHDENGAHAPRLCASR